MTNTGITDQDRASMEGPRALKEPGTTDWCWQTVSALQHMWQSLHLNYEHYMSILTEAEEQAIWEKIPPDDPYGTKEKMLKQVEVGDSKDAHKRMRVQTLAAQARAIQRQGRPNNGESKKGYNGNIIPSSRGNNATYLLGLMARDYPDMLERVKDGEFESVRAAAREAGIPLAQPKPTMSLGDDVDKVALKLKARYTAEQIRRIVEVLTEDGEEG